MIKVKIEIWMWLEKELETDTHSQPKMRSIIVEDLEDGITIIMLMGKMENRYQIISENIFDKNKNNFYPTVVVTLNDHVVTPYEVFNRILTDGDKITVLPVHTGG